MKPILIVTFVLATSALAIPATELEANTFCPWIMGKDEIKGFPVLPGSGWDNLRNREMGPVADVSLTGDCSLSVDGLYALPSQVVAYPLKESRISLISNVIEHYENYSSSTSRSVNVGGGGSFFGGLFGISGKFSEEFQQVKKTALYSKTQIGRTQQRYKTYVVRMLPDFRLHSVFRSRLIEIGKAVMQNLTSQTRYLSDLLVRDFGTHVITSLDAGAILEKLDYFKLDSLTKSVYTTNKITQCISVDFFSMFSGGESSTLSVTNEELKGYRASVQKTTVNAHGGPAVGAKINLTSWKNGLKQNLVAIDKSGDLLFTVVSHRTLPELPRYSLRGVSDAVKDAVTRYYTMNTIKGCLNPESPNFEPLANIEGTCDAPLTNFSFGGVFQTCRESPHGLPVTLCGQSHSPVQINYFTGGYSCPDGYEPILLFSFVGYCRDRYFWWRREMKTVVSAYWCAVRRDRSLPSQSGVLYGGASSPRVNNPKSGGKACPASYQPYRIGRDITMCVSSDMTETVRAVRIPFGGLFTCGSGNPLAEPGRRVVSADSSKSKVSPPPPPPPPRRCPEGFTQSAMDIFNGCEIMQCTRTLGTRNYDSDDNRLAMSRRPPFEDAPETSAWEDVNSGSSSSNQQGTAVINDATESSSSGGVLTVTLAVCITVGVALALIGAAGFAVFKMRARRRHQPGRWVEVCGSQQQETGEAADASTEEDSRQPLLG